MTPAVRPGVRPAALVLDNEAAQALADPGHPKHRAVLAHLLATSTRRRRGARSTAHVPTAVRVEAGIDRRAPVAATFNRFRVLDVPLTAGHADRAGALRPVGGSAVDACVAVAAAELSATADVLVLTSDLTDIPALLAAGAAGAPQARTRRL